MSWPDYMSRVTGANVINLGLGGSRIVPRNYVSENTTDWAYSKCDILNAVKGLVGGVGSDDYTNYVNGLQYIYDNVGSLIVDKDNIARIKSDVVNINMIKVDAVVIFAGFNDWFASASTKEEVLSALQDAIEILSTAYPRIQIYYCNPMPSFYPTTTADNYNVTRGGVTQEDFCNKMCEAGEGVTQVNVFDSFHKMGINAYNGLFWYPSDQGVHPFYNTKSVAKKIGAWLNSQYCV
jgi:lysophospholipase L1-like esterase